MKTERFLYLIVIAVLFFVLGILYSNEGSFIAKDRYEIEPDLSGGEYIRFVFIGSYSCPYSNNDATHKMVTYIKETLKQAAQDNSIKFLSTGISVDNNPQVGFKYLEKTNPYSEIISGASAFNLGSIYYGNGIPATPEILVIYEQYSSELVGINSVDLENSQTLIKDYLGVSEIESLYEFIKSSTNQEIIEYLNISI